MARHTNLYQRVRYYDIALQRPVSDEVDFFQQVFERHSQRPLQSLLEIACGPSYHGIELAQRGVRVTGLDLVPEMIDFARERAVAARTTMDWVVADMRDFKLAAPVDMAICVFDAVDVLTSNDDLLHHLACVANNLAPGGLYLIHMTHPRYSSLTDYGTYRYEGQRDGVEVTIDWAVNNPIFDPVTAVAHVEIALHIRDNGNSFTVLDSADERLLTPQELILLARLSGRFEAVGWYGNFDVNQPLDYSEKAQHAIGILQNRRV